MSNAAGDYADIFKSMIDAPDPGKGNYINEDGSFVVEITAAFGKDGFKGKKFITSFKVLESTNPNIPVGCTKDWAVDWTKKINFSDLKAFALAAANLPKVCATKREADEQATYMVYAAAGPEVAGAASTKAREIIGAKPEDKLFVGFRVRLDTQVTVSQTSGKPFTRHRWTAV